MQMLPNQGDTRWDECVPIRNVKKSINVKAFAVLPGDKDRNYWAHCCPLWGELSPFFAEAF